MTQKKYLITYQYASGNSLVTKHYYFDYKTYMRIRLNLYCSSLFNDKVNLVVFNSLDEIYSLFSRVLVNLPSLYRKE